MADSPPAIVWGADLPDPTSRHIPIVVPKGRQMLELVILGPGEVTLTHWIPDPTLTGGGRTGPHLTPRELCLGCVRYDQVPRWHTYLPCYDFMARRYVLADLTAWTIHHTPDLDPSRGVRLRGRRVTIGRNGDSHNSPIMATLRDMRIEERDLPACFQVRAALLRLWGYKTDGE